MAADDGDVSQQSASRSYAWIVFAVSFGLLLSDYMSRQVLNAVFPQLKAEWLLSDTRLGALSGVVSLAVGVLAFPLSLLADRWGRIQSLVLMAALWSLATLACGLAQDFQQMFIARFLVGIGEAAYGSVGLAVVLMFFPVRMRATIAGAFLAGGLVGSVLGISLGGMLAAHFGWRAAFAGMAVFGLVLTVCYACIVRESGTRTERQTAQPAAHPRLRELIASRSVICAYLGSGVQVFITGALVAWLPSYLHRYYEMSVAQAGVVAALFVLSSAAGMALCGNLCDRIAGHSPAAKFSLAVTYCVTCCVLLSIALQLPVGTSQLVMIALGMFFGAGTVGPAGAMVVNLTPAPIHGTALATLSLANNLLGLAPGPIVTGMLADAHGLPFALQLVPLVSLVAALIFAVARHSYQDDVRHVQLRTDAA
ncbi:MAG: MFS transporter [Steroidobacteraceae bacterium]